MALRMVSRREFLGISAGTLAALTALRASPVEARSLPPRSESVPVFSTEMILPPTSFETLLALRPFAHTDASPFQTDVDYPPARGKEPGERQVVDMLDEFLEAEFPSDPATRKTVRTLFDDPLAREKVPSPSLRCALVGLWRTSAGPAIEHVLSAKVESGAPKVLSVTFDYDGDVFSKDSDAIAEVRGSGGQRVSTRQQRVFFNPVFRAESPFHFMGTMSHEPLHQDGTVTNLEETICTLIDSVIALELLSRHPDLFKKGSALAERKSRAAMLRLNSGPGSRLGLYASATGRPIYPRRGDGATSLWESREDKSDLEETPGHALLAKYLESFRYPENPPAPAESFSMDLVRWLDRNAASLSPRALLAAARALKLEIPA